jgi:hypothetical protein
MHVAVPFANLLHPQHDTVYGMTAAPRSQPLFNAESTVCVYGHQDNLEMH